MTTSKCCKHCNDGEGNTVYPYYGVAPSENTGAFENGGDITLPVFMFPANFQLDGSWTITDACGTYTHCLECGAGNPPEFKETLDAPKYQINPNTFTPDDVNQALVLGAEIAGLPFEFFKRVASIESSLRYWITRGEHVGLFQMGKIEFEAYRESHHNDPLNPYHNAVAAANYMKYHIAQLANRGVTNITPVRLYLCHQQGLGGCSQIFSCAENPDIKLDDNVKSNMLHNPAPTGGEPTSDPKKFISEWESIFDTPDVPSILVTTFSLKSDSLGNCPFCSDEIKEPSYNSILQKNYCSPQCRSEAMYHGESFLEVRRLVSEGKASLAQIKELTIPSHDEEGLEFNPIAFK